MSYKLTAYLLPGVTGCVIVKFSEFPGSIVDELSGDQVLEISPFTLMFLTVKLLVPELVTCTTMLPGLPIFKSNSVIVSSLVSMYPMVSEPIHAATAMETATVTAMSMMAATTGLRAFLLFRSFFIFGSFPSLSAQYNSLK
jgi:hypothetical protein